jgi:8-oxo-(d)GTP phosphatase
MDVPGHGSIVGMTLLLVRHGHAGRRSAYKGEDRLRPLSKRGLDQARELVTYLSAHRPQRILSSPYVRCCETVRPTAEALGLAVESIDELAEGRGADAVRLMERMAGESAVLCTHGDVAAQVLEALTPGASDNQRKSMRLQKGDFWVIQSTGTSLAIVEHVRLPKNGDRPIGRG